MSPCAAPAGFPGTLHGGDGRRLAGDGPECIDGLVDTLPHKALPWDTPGRQEVALLQAGDRPWLPPDGFGTPPELPMPLLLDLAEVVRRGGKVAFAAADPDAYALVRGALVPLLDGHGGRA